MIAIQMQCKLILVLSAHLLFLIHKNISYAIGNRLNVERQMNPLCNASVFYDPYPHCSVLVQRGLRELQVAGLL
jgi:hypothetical protein